MIVRDGHKHGFRDLTLLLSPTIFFHNRDLSFHVLGGWMTDFWSLRFAGRTLTKELYSTNGQEESTSDLIVS